MSVFAAGRQLGSTFKLCAVAKQLRAVSLFHPCNANSKFAFVQRTLCETRHYSHPSQTDSEDTLIESAAKNEAHDLSESKKKRGFRGKLNKKLHRRVFSEQELADNRAFRSQSFNSGSEGDTFGILQKRGTNKQVSDHSSDTPFTADVTIGTLGSPGTNSGTAKQKGASSKIRFTKEGGISGQQNTVFPRRSRQAKQRHNWNDEFGTLSEDSIADRIQESLHTSVGSHEERFGDDEDEEESQRIRLSAVNRRHVPEWYGRKILKLGKRGQIRDAIEVFEDWMLKTDRVMPNSYVFTCLLTVLGRAGYTKKAFSLFNKMKSMDIQPKPAAYTALFNACSNSPWKNDGKSRAENLVQLMKEKEVKPTFITGKAMVKAFALCGDLRRAFSLVDELSQVYRPDPEMFSFLLMACISDKDLGLRHAIQVWRLMQQMGVQPDLPLYNLLIRCVRDCGVGDARSFTTLLTGGATSPQVDAENHELDQEVTFLPSETEFTSASVSCEPISPESETFDSERQPETDDRLIRKLEVGEQMQVKSLQNVQGFHSASELTVHSSATIPDALSANSQNSRIVSVDDLSRKEKRLLLLGGVEGILSQMAKDRASPDVITFTQLISVAVPTVEAEQQLLDMMRSMCVKPDIDLVNTLIHKRCTRGDIAAARAAAELMSEYRLTANQRTYGILAMTCKTQEAAAQLLGDIEAADMAPNMEILGTLMYTSGMKFGYKLWILRQAQRLDLPPNTKFLHNVERGLAIVRQKMVDAEKQGLRDSHILSPTFQECVQTFIQHYESWLKQTRVQSPGHPWANFKPLPADHKDAASA